MQTKIAIVLLLCIAAQVSWGAGSALSWTQPTKNTDGSAIGTITANNLYRGSKPDGSDLVFLAQLKPAASTYSDTNLLPGTYCYAVTAVTWAESPKSNVQCKTIDPPLPGAPVLGTITLAVNSVAADWTKLAFVPSKLVGTAPLGTPCDPNKHVEPDYYAIPASFVTWATSYHPSNVISRCAAL